LRLSTEGLERPTPVRKENNFPFIFIICFVLLLSLGGYLYNKGKLHEVYLSTKETLIGLNLDEKKEYLGILYRQGHRIDAAKILEQIISFSQEDNEQNRAFLAFLYFNQEDYEKALLIYKKLVKESDSPEQYIFYYASCLFHQGEIDEALKQHYQLFSIADHYVDNVDGILKILLKQKKKQEGLSFLEGYLRKYPSAQTYLGVYEHRFNQIVEAEEEAESATIRIPEVNKAFHAKVKIGTNKYPYTYIIDTGAIITTISPKIYRANEGVIRKTGKKYTFENADGSTHEAEEVFIDWIKIGGIELQNVRAILKQKGGNLLGQNVLGKLKISIQKENNINIMTLSK
jgi:tetratricopeptide (TPR) repeat protein